ncbi:nucleolar and coiled-body phosphoprotein 1-like isoform X2 [Phymastichus coffea]|uniref:nucleolar and coiled-body phosphoprotein 1-like isoform X2 n=1 Tax=Phymastichus coffea TaxID=108790 RepID=UPI00273C7DDB|nr:nucleolar and coiled-body phosphoprotein 1-like isoform X2 [Phymastichus coffea]
MAKIDRDGASARSDNRRMTGNVNIYVCSGAFGEGDSNSLKNKDRKNDSKKGKGGEKLISKKTRKDRNGESKSMKAEPTKKMSNDVTNDPIKSEALGKAKRLHEESKEKHDRDRPTEKSPKKKSSSDRIDQGQRQPKSQKNKKAPLDEKATLTRNDTNKGIENEASARDATLDAYKNTNKKSWAKKVKVKNKAHAREDAATARKSKSIARDPRKARAEEDRTSFIAKLVSLFRSKRDEPTGGARKVKGRCDASCTESRRTTKASRSARRKGKSKRRKHRPEPAGKTKGQKPTEVINPRNESDNQANERKAASRRASTPSHGEETSELEATMSKAGAASDSRATEEAALGDADRTDGRSRNSLRVCLSCLLPSGSCLCGSESAEQRKAATVGRDRRRRATSGSSTLPCRKLKTHSVLVGEMREKMGESARALERGCGREGSRARYGTIAPRARIQDAQPSTRCLSRRCARRREERRCDAADKKPRAKCYYCENPPRWCCCCASGH